MYVVFGSRFWDVSVKQYLNDQHTNTYSAKYSLGSVGIGTNYQFYELFFNIGKSISIPEFAS